MNSKGNLIILSGPSGVGKDAVLKQVLTNNKNVKLSISCVTRSMRVGEVHGEKYYFKTKEQFEKMIKKDELLEYNIYLNNYYGTPKGPVEKMIEDGYTVILEIDVNGALKVMEKVPDATTIFLAPKSVEVLKERLEKRGTEEIETIQKRLAEAKREISFANKYQYYIVNENIDQAASDFEAIIRATALKYENVQEKIIEVTQNA